MKHNNLNKLHKLLVEKQNDLNSIKYHIPSIWLDYSYDYNNLIPVNFPQFLVNKIDEIISISQNKESKQTKKRIYNSFVRLTTSFNHQSNYKISLSYNFNNNGTFLKTIAILPYLKLLGITHLHLLPITEIGIDGRKGNLGSPYSIKNHLKLDRNLTDTIVEMTAEEQFTALVEACHLIGIKVILEMVFRTSSKDNDLIFEHPEWFYWIKSNKFQSSFKPPKFEQKQLLEIKNKVEKLDFQDLIPPVEEYRNRFCEAPIKVWKENNKLYGTTKDGKLCEIPGAFADWPPDDTQPLWSDVMYLKLHNHPDFNYIAYNTVRMYDNKLKDKKYRNTELWEYLSNIIPFYIETFDIDGVLIDMGHALPKELLTMIIENAKKLKSDFMFIEENFVVSNHSLEKGFEAVVGYLPFDLIDLEKTINLINELSVKELNVKYFGTAETHNTPRAYWRAKTKNYSIYTYLLSNLLNNSIPFIHNGFELLEEVPVNTGLDFLAEEVELFPILPLFDYFELNWQNSNRNIICEIIQINKITDELHLSSIRASELLDKILLVEFDDTKNNYILLVNYSKKPCKLDLQTLKYTFKKVLYQLEVDLNQNNILFNSYFSFVFGILDK